VPIEVSFENESQWHLSPLQIKKETTCIAYSVQCQLDAHGVSSWEFHKWIEIHAG